MRALENIHSALRPQGLLLDVHPEPRHPWVEVYRGTAADGNERVVQLGQVDVSYRIGTLATSDAALQTVINAGLFFCEHAETFAFTYHFDSVDTWRAYMAEHWKTAHVTADVIARAREEFSREAGELRIPRAIHAARLRKCQ